MTIDLKSLFSEEDYSSKKQRTFQNLQNFRNDYRIVVMHFKEDECNKTNEVFICKSLRIRALLLSLITLVLHSLDLYLLVPMQPPQMFDCTLELGGDAAILSCVGFL